MVQKTLYKSPVKPSVSINKSERSDKINKFFKSKQRYEQEAFFEGIFTIKLQGGKRLSEYGYSKNFNPSNKAEYNNAIESAFMNALAKVSYREGWSFDGSTDVMILDNEEVEETELIDYYLYYVKNLDTNAVRFKRKRKDGTTYSMVRFTRNGKFVNGGGLEDKEKSISQTNKLFDLREQSFSKNRQEVKDKSLRLELAEKYK